MTGQTSGAERVVVREVAGCDLSVFFEQQLDPEANRMVAFTSENPSDREAFDTRWKSIMGDEEITARTIVHGKNVAGHILCFEQFDEREVSYWIGPEYRGRG